MAKLPPTPTKLRPHVLWMIKRDMPEVYDIENEVFTCPWSEDDFISTLRERMIIGMVAEIFESRSDYGVIAGYMVYQLYAKRLELLNFAVAGEYQRRGVGSAMLDKLRPKISYGDRRRILAVVPEQNLPAQLFFRASGFRAVSVLRDHFEDTDEDAYLFQLRRSQPATYGQIVGRNRISQTKQWGSWGMGQESPE